MKRLGLTPATWSSLITIARIVKFSRLLHPVGSGFVSQNPSRAMSPNTRTRRWLEGTLHPLQPDTPQAHPMPPEL